MTPIIFYLDFSSPYAYFASLEIEALASKHDRSVLWRPMMLGRVFQNTGGQPLFKTEKAVQARGLISAYSRQDWDRIALLRQAPWHFPPVFPLVTIPTSRGFYWLEETEPDKAVPYAKAVFKATFVEGRDTSSEDTAVEIAESLGADGEALRTGIGEPETKQRLKDVGEEAVALGMPGAPYFVADKQGFWGWDRMGMMDVWLTHGEWGVSAKG